jgi:predicted Rossmann-fold nucleotide-binding protein
MPGGFGTLDEIFEVATLIQTHKIFEFPLVLVGKEFWQPLIMFMRERLLAEKTIDVIDCERILVTDSPEEAVQLVTAIAMRQFGLTYGSRMKRRWWLGE